MGKARYMTQIISFRAVATDDTQTRDEIILAYMGMIPAVAGLYSLPGSELYDELVAVGNLALTEAVQEYDPVRGVELPVRLANGVGQAMVGFLRKEYRRSGGGRGVVRCGEIAIDDPPDEPILVDEEIQILRTAMQRLNQDERELLESLVVGMGGQPPLVEREWAEKLGITQQAVNKRKAKIFEELQWYCRALRGYSVDGSI